MEQVLYQLPEGWEWQTFNEVCTKITDGAHASPKTVEDGFPYVTVRDIDNKGYIDTINCKRISEEDFLSLKKGNCLPPVDSLLLSKDGTVGKVAQVTSDYDEFVVLSSLAIIVPDKQLLLPEYLKYFLMSPEFQDFAIGIKTGAAIKRIVLRTIKNFNIPIAPLEKQKRIVEKLDALLPRIDTAIEHLQESVTLTDSMFVSGMDKAFNPLSLPPNETGLYELPKEWAWQNLGSISTIGTGVTPLKGRADYYNNGHISWVTSKATGDDFVFDSEQKITEVALSECRLKLFPAGTLIVALYGQGKTRGQVSELLIESTINQALAAVVVNPDHNSKFVKYFLKRSYLLLRSKASGGTQENLNLSIIKAIQVPLPDTQQQRKIVLSLDALSDQVNQVKSELTSKIELLNQLKASILDSAFKGEL